MATFKAEVYAHQKKADGTYNIKIRVTQNQKKRYLATVYFITKDDLTRSMKIKNQKYIDACDNIIKKYRSICERVGERLRTMNVDQVVDLINNDKGDSFDLDFVSYGRNIARQLTENGHSGNARTYANAINNLVKFVGRDKISIKEITVAFLKDWVKWIGDQGSTWSQHNYLSSVRSLHNMAKKEFNDEDAGIIRIPNSPFSNFSVPQIPSTRKRAISIDLLGKIATLPYTDVVNFGNNRFNLAKDVFMLSFMLIGMNAVDLYYCTDCKDGRITYQRTKTKNRRADKAEISIKIQPEVKPLIEKYKDPSGERVFNFYKHYSSVGAFSAAINGYDRIVKGIRTRGGLKKIGYLLGIEDLEFYAARHTWATIAVNDAGVDKYTVHQALNHVDDTMRVTDIYIKKSWKKVDEANRKVLDLIKIKMDLEEPIYQRKFPKNTWKKKKENFA